MSRNSLPEAGAKSEFLSDCNWTRTHNHLVHKRKLTNHMHRTDKYSQHSSIIRPVWPNGRVFVYELSGCGFESSAVTVLTITIKQLSY